MRFRGMSEHRWKDNPEEKRFADAWAEFNRDGIHLDHLLDQRKHQTGRAPFCGDQAQMVAATMIQWLGSPVGQNWLRDLGYVKGKRP